MKTLQSSGSFAFDLAFVQIVFIAFDRVDVCYTKSVTYLTYSVRWKRLNLTTAEKGLGGITQGMTLICKDQVYL